MMVVLALSVRAEEDEGGGRQSRAEQERSVAVEFTCASGEPWPALFKKRGGERDRRGEGEGEGPSASRPWGCCAAQGRAPHHTAHRHPAPHTGLLRRTQAARAAAALDPWVRPTQGCQPQDAQKTRERDGGHACMFEVCMALCFYSFHS